MGAGVFVHRGEVREIEESCVSGPEDRGTLSSSIILSEFQLHW